MPAFNGYMQEQNSTKSIDPNAVYRSKQFKEAMDYFDTQDDMTRKVLLTVNEADQNAVMVSLSNKLYQHIVDKVDDIDFGTIPLSRGDITKIDNYDKLVDCINVISQILQQYNQSTESINTVINALQNLQDRTDLFTKAYKLNVEMPIIIYNTIALSIVSSVSYLITSCIEFVKLPDDQGFDIALDKAALMKARDAILFKDLAKFNKLCDTGEFDKAMDFVMKQNATQQGFTGGFELGFAASSVVVILGIILIIIPLIRELIFFFYYSRTKISDYFDAQAALLEINSYNIENNLTREDKNKKEIAKKQRKVAETFKKIANAIKIDTKTGEQKAEKDIKELDSKKYKQDEVLDKMPDSSNSVLF